MGMIQPVNGDDYHFNLLILIGFLLPKTFKLLKSVKTLKTTTAKKELGPLGTPSRQEHEGASPFILPWNRRRFLIPKKKGAPPHENRSCQKESCAYRLLLPLAAKIAE
jgi:hypothetical protein